MVHHSNLSGMVPMLHTGVSWGFTEAEIPNLAAQEGQKETKGRKAARENPWARGRSRSSPGRTKAMFY